jgi:hypothetical protein
MEKICQSCHQSKSAEHYRKNGVTCKECLENQEGYVYFIYIPERYEQFKCVKIGQTKNLKQRLAALQTGNPWKLSIYRYVKSTDYVKYERELHKKYQEQRFHNEWFTITLEDVDKLLGKENVRDKVSELADDFVLLSTEEKNKDSDSSRIGRLFQWCKAYIGR